MIELHKEYRVKGEAYWSRCVYINKKDGWAKMEWTEGPNDGLCWWMDMSVIFITNDNESIR